MISFVSKLIEDKETRDPSAKKGIPTTKSHNTAHLGIYTHDREDDSTHTVLLREIISSEELCK